ncbi:hypothetical protein C8A05DRAFT_43624 [Staphylotrichum tortipilum]|uniref:Uncharacterized protein n=1 Tax=Staphylotrichum tortipilum TaxID=2831512 RepID=A0AAN6MMF5_9PEZI|nr:hypothetical protein C8A05DRAFT_43624 [Staphylotrichum longicolle]
MQLPLADLDGAHYDLLVRAISRVLFTEIAEITYAQIIDGLPIADVADDTPCPIYGNHTIFEVHEELCPGMLDKAREFRAQFQPEIMTFIVLTHLHLLHDYRTCAPGSRRFKIVLIELVAVAVHQLAALLFELDTSMHKDDGITGWTPPLSGELYWKLYLDGPLPTLFRHGWYKDYPQYPRGVADMVGYWAEARILGGVVLFDRRDPDSNLDPDPYSGSDANPEVDPDAVYLHSDRALLDFLLADAEPAANPLPILGGPDNRVRVKPEEPILETGIFRDPWERKALTSSDGDLRLRDVINQTDYPTFQDRSAAMGRALDRLEIFRRQQSDEPLAWWLPTHKRSEELGVTM